MSVSERYAYIILSTEKWWNRLCVRSENREVHTFIRRGWVAPTNVKLLLFYVTSPIREIRGTGEFIERVIGKADELWNRYSHETSLNSYEEYLNFMQGRKKVTFLRFRNFRKLAKPVPANTIFKVTGISRMPRGGKYISRETANQLVV